MTNEEAIARIREHKIIHKMNEPRAIYISEALDMGIEALENQKSVIEELEKIKAEITACTQQEEGEVPACINYGIKLSTEIVEKHISELKGEQE